MSKTRSSFITVPTLRKITNQLINPRAYRLHDIFYFIFSSVPCCVSVWKTHKTC